LAQRGTADIPVNGLRPEKLGVIEKIESFEPKLQ
jgi:hypothetical protein